MGWKTVLSGMTMAGTLTLALQPPAVAAQAVEVGVKAGAASTTVAWSPSPLGDGFEELERRKAATFGGYLDARVLDAVHLRAEILLSPKGFREVQSNGENTRLEVGYVEVPILVGVRPPSLDGPVVPEVYAGGWMAWERSCTAGLEAGTVALDFDCDEIPDEPVLRQTTDWGLAVGAALGVRLGSRLRSTVDLRYTRALRNIDASEALDNNDVRHRGLALTVGLGVRLGR